MVYALKNKKHFLFQCIAKTEKEMEEKIETSYWNWRSARPRSASEESKSKEVFLSGLIKVKITIERL